MAAQLSPARGLLVLLVPNPGEQALDLENRRHVFVVLNRYPGLTMAGLARQADLDEDLVRYHVRVLEKAGLARSQRQEGHRRVYPLERTAAGSKSPLDEEDRLLLGLLRRPPVLRATVALLEQGPLAAGELADACGIAPSTMSHHLARMEEGDLVRAERKGRSRVIGLVDPDRVLTLLSEHPPPEDLVQDFIEAWDELGF